tara:strand:+ start:5 stop:775 length:771 start_codon:yes stop_codon:yes gene_type:complete
MAIDWVTVAAQVVNFLILIWLLKRFLYRPILDGIDARERDIAGRVEAAERAKAEAEAAAAAHRQAAERVEAEKVAVLQSARDAAEAEQDKLRTAAKRKIEAEQQEWTRQMNDLRDAYANELRTVGGEALVSLTRKALHDLADADLEERIAHHLAARLVNLKNELQGASNRAEEAVAVSTTQLPEECRQRLADAFRSLVADVPLRFETDANQSPGIVLQFGGGRIAWTIDAYLDRLAATVAAKLADGQQIQIAAAAQ